MEPCVEVNRDDFMQYLEYDYWRQFCKVTGKVYRTPWSIGDREVPISFFMVLFQPVGGDPTIVCEV